MILTMSPYLEVATTDGVLLGGLAEADDSIDLKVRVQCPSWIDIDRIQVLVNGRPVKNLNFTCVHPTKTRFTMVVAKFDPLLASTLESRMPT